MPEDNALINACLCASERTLYKALPDFHLSYLQVFCEGKAPYDDAFQRDILKAGYWAARESIGLTSRVADICRLVFPFQFLQSTEKQFLDKLHWEFHPNKMELFCREIFGYRLQDSVSVARDKLHALEEKKEREIDALLRKAINITKFNTAYLESLGQITHGAMLVWRDYIYLPKHKTASTIRSNPRVFLSAKADTKLQYEQWNSRVEELWLTGRYKFHTDICKKIASEEGGSHSAEHIANETRGIFQALKARKTK